MIVITKIEKFETNLNIVRIPVRDNIDFRICANEETAPSNTIKCEEIEGRSFFNRETGKMSTIGLSKEVEKDFSLIFGYFSSYREEMELLKDEWITQVENMSLWQRIKFIFNSTRGIK